MPASSPMDYDYQRLQMRPDDVVFHSNIMVERQCKRFWFVKDYCGIICAVLTWSLILYAEFVVMTVILLPSPYPVYSYVNMVIFNLLAFLATASHMRTMFSDPVRDSSSSHHYPLYSLTSSFHLLSRAPSPREMPPSR